MKRPRSKLLRGLFDYSYKQELFSMWFFLIKQNALETSQYQSLQKQVLLTEIELFNEPYENWYVFSIEKENYQPFMSYLDREGIAYELMTERPTRSELLDGMR